MLNQSEKDSYPKIGPFYYYKNSIIAHDDYQKRVNPVTFKREVPETFIMPGEHRDMWDGYMVIEYPELKQDYDDSHKALPRGRVDYIVKNNDLHFFITLDKCIKQQENEIKRVYNIKSYTVKFLYGAMNYYCKDCKENTREANDGKANFKCCRNV